MAVETVAHIRAVRNVADDAVLFAELLYLQAAQGFCRCAVDRIEDAVLFLKLGNLVVDIFQRVKCELSVLNKRFSVVQLLQLVQRRDTERCGHRL